MHQLLPHSILDEITVVIPAKGPADIAHAERIKKRLDVPVIIVRNKPYGRAIKEGMALADTEYIITMDADGQHSIFHVYYLSKIAWLNMKLHPTLRMVVAARQHWNRRVPNVALSLIASVYSWQWVQDLGSGLRMFHRKTALGYLAILPDNFAFNTALTMAFIADGLFVCWTPLAIQPRQWGVSSVNKLVDGMRAVWHITRIGIAMRTRSVRQCLRDYR